MDLMDWEEGRLVFKFVFRLVFWAQFRYEFWNGLCWVLLSQRSFFFLVTNCLSLFGLLDLFLEVYFRIIV